MRQRKVAEDFFFFLWSARSSVRPALDTTRQTINAACADWQIWRPAAAQKTDRRILPCVQI